MTVPDPLTPEERAEALRCAHELRAFDKDGFQISEYEDVSSRFILAAEARERELREALRRDFFERIYDYDYENGDGSPGWHLAPHWELLKLTDEEVRAALRQEAE